MNLRDIRQGLESYQVVLEPDENVPEWWAGAPSAVVAEDGSFYLAARMREGDSPRGKRGYEIRILKSRDGLDFSPIASIKRNDAALAGFERPALRRDPGTGRYKLYGCAPLPGGWAILKFDDADDPSQFRPATAHPVLTADNPRDGFVHVTGYKDPFLYWEKGLWHMFVIAADRVERIRRFTSGDGEHWEPASPDPVMENAGWHNFYTRPACVLPLAAGYLFVYEGSNVAWRDPVYNIATGLAYSPGLETFYDLTPGEPLLKSVTPGHYHTWRYSDWVRHDGRLYVYWEAARANNTNEIRVSVLPLGDPG